MKLVLLGTTGYHPCDRRQTACFMLPELGVVLDAGTGAFRVADYLQTDSLDFFLTHTHLDHVVGVTFLFDILYERELKSVRIHAEPEKIAAIQDHLLAAPLFPVTPPGEYVPLAGPVQLPGGGTLKHFPLKHPGGSVGFRLDWPTRSLAYVTDTTAAPDAAYIKHIRGVDVLVHECYFADGQEDQAELTGHSCLTPVLQVAAAANVGRLILVHINPLFKHDRDLGLDAVRSIFSAVDIGVDGMEIEF